MPYYMYVSLQDDDKIAVYTMDAGTGTLTPQGEVPVAGGPSPLTMSPDRQVLYVGHHTVPGISSLPFAQIWREIPDCAKLWACMIYRTSSRRS